MIEDMIYKSFYLRNNTILKEENRKVEPILGTNSAKNNLKGRDVYKEYQKNVDNDNRNKTRKDDIFMIKDTCEISKEAMALYEFAKKEVERTPDIRTDKVDDIKNRLNNNEYNVPIEALADKLIGKGI